VQNSSKHILDIDVHGHHNVSGPEAGQSHRLHCEKGPAEEVQPATGAAVTVLCHH